jgi:ABC-2 type transport system permease protein
MTLNYAWMSALPIFRNARFVIFTAALPVIMYLLFNGLYGSEASVTAGMSTGVYLMVSMACYGALGAALNAGTGIALERRTGWNRQLRLTALSPQGYLVAKGAVSMLVALPALALVFVVAGTVGHVHLSVVSWLLGGVVIWISIIPFAVLGLVIGFLATPDSTQPISMFVYIGLSILGGLWVPLEQFPAVMTTIGKLLPTYWVAENGRDAVAGAGVSGQGIAVLVGWTVVLGALGMAAYRRSGRRA